MLRLRKLPVAKKTMEQRGAGYQDFPSKKNCLTMPKIFAKEPFVLCFRKLPLAEKILDKRGGIKTFRRRIFVSQCRKPSQLNAFVLCLTKLPVAKKIMVESGVTRFSVTKFSFHSAEKFLRGTLRCCV